MNLRHLVSGLKVTFLCRFWRIIFEHRIFVFHLIVFMRCFCLLLYAHCLSHICENLSCYKIDVMFISCSQLKSSLLNDCSSLNEGIMMGVNMFFLWILVYCCCWSFKCPQQCDEWMCWVVCNEIDIGTPHTHHNRFTALFRDNPGEPVPEKNFWTLWCKGRLTEADTPTIRLGATPSGLTSAHLYHPPLKLTLADTKTISDCYGGLT